MTSANALTNELSDILLHDGLYAFSNAPMHREALNCLAGDVCCHACGEQIARRRFLLFEASGPRPQLHLFQRTIPP